MTESVVVFPSSTSRDLPDERRAVLEACRDLNLGVATMEGFPATGQGATAGSLHHLDKCHVYVGVFARRYGYVEEGYPCSVTEAESESTICALSPAMRPRSVGLSSTVKRLGARRRPPASCSMWSSASLTSA